MIRFYSRTEARALGSVRHILVLLLTLLSFGAFSQVTVSGALVGDGPYTTLGAAFTAINGGAQTGANISIVLSGNTTEASTATLNAGAWTSVSITASVPVTVSGSITGAVIRLFGADFVTIDGRIGGVGNNISVSNTSTAASTAAIWISSNGAAAGATNNVIRNLNLACGADPTTSTNATFGICASGTSISTSNAGIDNDNNQYLFNNITRCRYGISLRGNSAADLTTGTVIADNVIGSSSFDTNRIGKVGIFVQFENGALITRNTIRNIGILIANSAGGADRVGIALGNESWSSSPSTNTNTNLVCTRNNIQNIVDEKTFSAVGIALGTTNAGNPTNNIVANNCITGVRSNGTAGDAGTGIGISGGNGDLVVFNSIAMTGDVDPTGVSNSTQIHTCLRVAGTPLNLTIRNNAFYMDQTSNTTSLNHSCIQLPSATFAFGTGALNNNDYYYPVSNTQARTGAIGTTSLPTTFFATLANWQAALTPSQDAASVSLDPNFVDPASDLHNNGVTYNLDALAVPIAGVTDDFDGQIRDAGTPDIGCDEFASPACAVAEGGTANTTTPTRCEGQSATVSATGVSVGSGTIRQWLVSTTSGSGYTPVVGGSGANSTTYTSGPLTPGTYYYVLETTCTNDASTDLSSEIAVLVYGNQAAITASDTEICAGESVTLTETGGTGLSWFWSTFEGTQSILVSPGVTTTYAVAVTSDGSCANNANITITVNQLPTGVTANASAANVCEGATVDLTATGTSVAQQIVFSENFNGDLSAWTNINNSTGGTPADAAWTLRTSPYVYSTSTFNSNDLSQFVMSNSDDQGSGSTTNVELISPAFSTLGGSNATINFYHYFKNLNTSDFPYVEASTDLTNWTTLATYAVDQGTSSGFVPAVVNLDAFANQATVYIRFRYVASWGWYWAIDNLTVTMPADLTWSWSSNPASFASTDQNPTGVVVNQTLDYIVTATDIVGCSSTSAPVTVIADPSGCTDSQAPNYDPLAVCDDGTCAYLFGENPINAIESNIAVYPACAGNTLDLSAYGPSGAAQTSAITGEDIWYYFVAPTSGASIRVVAGVNDILIELQDAFGNLIDSENLVSGAGDEVLNISNLVPGETYVVGVRNYDSSLGIGPMTLCVKYLIASTCDYGSGPYSLCSTYKADYVAAQAYRFDFTSTTTLQTYSKTQVGTTFLPLAQAGIPWGDTYDVSITAIYYGVENGTGTENVEVATLSPCQIIISAQPLAELRAQDQCSNGPRFRGATVAATPHVCGVVDYKWTFTRTDIAELPFDHYRGAANRYLALGTVAALVSGATYDVVVTPVFSYGEGVPGDVQCMSIVGPVAMPGLSGDQDIFSNEKIAAESMIDVAVYPNPSNGEMMYINLTGIETDVVIMDIVDLTGKLVSSNQFTVDGSLNTIVSFEEPLANGVYFVKFNIGAEVRTERFVVQR